MRISILQTDIVWENKQENLRRLREKLETLRGTTEIVVLPETFSTGFSMDTASLAEPTTGEKMVKYTEEQIIGLIHRDYQGKKIFMRAPLVRTRKGHYKELFEQVRKKGYLYVRVDGEVREIVHGMKLDRYKNHDIER